MTCALPLKRAETGALSAIFSREMVRCSSTWMRGLYVFTFIVQEFQRGLC